LEKPVRTSMNYQCLSRLDLEEFLSSILDGTEPNSVLRLLMDNCITYQGYLIGLTYFLAQLIDRRVRKNLSLEHWLENVFSIPDRMAFELQEIDVDFVDYLVRNRREKSLTLEENLIDIQNRFSAHQYGETFRFRYDGTH
jgi:hypothetical protein